MNLKKDRHFTVEIAWMFGGGAAVIAGSPQGLLPGAPTDPDVRVKRIRFVTARKVAVPHTIRSSRGDTLVRHGVLGVVPTPRPRRGAPFAPRGPEGRSPASTLLWGTATPCHPSRRTSFPSLGDTIVSSPVRPRRPGTGAEDHPGVGKPVLLPAITMETARSPKFPGNPFDHSPCSSDPGVTRHAGGSRCR